MSAKQMYVEQTSYKLDVGWLSGIAALLQQKNATPK
jgi:hypothetical protein